MAVWVLDKFTNAEHAAKVFGKYYAMPGLELNVITLIAVAQAAILMAFLLGYKKRFSYGAIFLMHLVSTLASWKMYLDMNLLFFAAWPMLAACFALYLLRHLDTKFTVCK
jgi:putative oxidoreductase